MLRGNAYIGRMERTFSHFAMGAARPLPAPSVAHARFSIGDVVQHRMFGFRGVGFDIDPVCGRSDEWYEAIPEAMGPAKDPPLYHLLP